MKDKVSIPVVLVKEHLAGYAFYQDLIEQLLCNIKEYLSLVLNAALEQEVAWLLGRAVYERRAEGNEKRVAAHCLRCHSRRQRDFVRDGHKSRGLVTLWGGYLLLQMPRVACAVCGGTVHVEYKTVAPRQRLWQDVREEAREACGLGQSLRQIKGRLEQQLRTSVGLRWLDEQMQRMSELVEQWRGAALKPSPPVLLLDALWMRVMRRTGRWRRDKKGRKRPVKGAVWVPVMVAVGLWPEERRRVILDWQIGRGPGEDAGSWLRLLTRLEERGVRGGEGLRLIIHDGSKGLEEALQEVHFGALQQRCIFHKLRNLLQAIVLPEDFTPEQGRKLRRQILREASAIWRAESKEGACQRQEEFCQHWAESQPGVVATIQRDFESTLTFYELLAWAAEEGKDWPVQWLRTTSVQERIHRSFRRKLRQMVLAHSEGGLQAVLYQATIRIAYAYSRDTHGWSRYIEQLLWDTS